MLRLLLDCVCQVFKVRRRGLPGSIVIANTHLYSSATAPQVRILQAHALLQVRTPRRLSLLTGWRVCMYACVRAHAWRVCVCVSQESAGAGVYCDTSLVMYGTCFPCVLSFTRPQIVRRRFGDNARLILCGTLSRGFLPRRCAWWPQLGQLVKT